MSTLMVLEQRKHDLRCQLVRSVKADGRKAMTTQRVWHKIIEVQKAEAYLKGR
jgi:hypothetical protein